MEQEQTPMLSVLVTFCRQGPYAEDCLQSLLEQKTRYPFEILAAVDGEDDGTMAILEKYSQKYPQIRYWKVFSDSRKLALSRASNNRIFLLKKALGKYLIVLDGDDFFCSERRFEDGIHFLEVHEDFISHTCEWVLFQHDIGSFQNIRQSYPQEMTIEKYMEGKIFFCLAMNLFRNIFIDGEEYPEPDFFDDTVLTTYLMSKGAFYFSAERMFAYRVGKDSCFHSRSEADQKLLELITCVIKKGMVGFEEKFNVLIKGYTGYIEKHPGELSSELRKQVLFQDIPLPFDLTIIGKNRAVATAKQGRTIRELLIRRQKCTETVRLSVLITFCHQLQYVEDCLESILNQECEFPFEVLIAVDGEDDGTISLLERYRQKYPFIQFWKVNTDTRLLAMSRVSLNRLFLLEKSIGEYFCILDGDDFYIDRLRFTEGVAFLDNHTEFIGQACELDMFNEETRSLLPEKTLSGYISASCCIFRNIFIKRQIKFPNCYFFDDTLIITFMEQYGEIYYSKKSGFAYRINCKSIFYSYEKNTRNLLETAQYLILYQLVKNNVFLNELSIRLSYLIDEGTFIFDEEIRRQILFQNLPIARDFVKISEYSEEERNKLLHNVYSFIKRWGPIGWNPKKSGDIK